MNSLSQSRVIFHVFCEGCGAEVTPCAQCERHAGPTIGFCTMDPTQPASFICESCKTKNPKALREGFVSLEEIMEGQHVTGLQFLNAVRCYEEEQDDEPVELRDPKTMSYRILSRAYDEVCENRKDLCKSVKRRGGIWTKEDESMMESMDSWAKKFFDEMRRR